MTYAKLLLAFGIWMIFTCEGQTDDWLDGLNMDLNEFQKGIQQGIQNLHYNIQKNVHESLADVEKNVAQIEKNVQEAIKKDSIFLSGCKKKRKKRKKCKRKRSFHYRPRPFSFVRSFVRTIDSRRTTIAFIDDLLPIIELCDNIKEDLNLYYGKLLLP